MISSARKLARAALVVSLAVAGATGCALFVDFSPYDTSDVPPEASVPDGSIFDAGPPFRISSVTPNPVSWRAGDTTSIHVSVLRNAAYMDKLALSATGLPSGVSVVSGSVEMGATSGDLVLTATTKAHAGLFHGATLVARTPNGITDQRAFDVEIAGAPGTLDESFGDGGVLALSIFGHAATLGPQDEIVVLGNPQDAGLVPPAVARYSADGTFDPAFGDAGLAFPIASTGGFGVAIAGDDAGYVVLETPQGLSGRRSLARIDLQGAPLADFGEGGTIEYTNKNGGQITTHPAVGAAVIMGVGVVSVFNLDWFSHDGTLIAHTTGPGRIPFLALDPAGRALVVTSGVHVQRLFGDGSVDPSVGDPSDAAVGLGTGETLGVVATTEATFVAANLSPYGIVKLRPNGTVDTSYGAGGFSTETVDRFAAADAGALYVTRGIAVGRLTPQGTTDPSFGAGPDMSDSAVTILVQRTGRIVVVGTASIHRYWP